MMKLPIVKKTIKFEPGYWSFQMIAGKLKELGAVGVTRNDHDRTCTLSSDGDIELGEFGCLLDFEKNTNLVAGDTRKSPNKTEINRGLRFATVSCNIVGTSGNVDDKGRKSNVITTLPIVKHKSLKGSVSRYFDVESRVPINKGKLSQLEFTVAGNNGTTNIGSVLLEVYIDL